MQPIVLIAIVGVAAATLGAGFLAPGFDLDLQNLAAQEDSLASPISTANVDFRIQKIEGFDDQGNTVFKNQITECSFHSPDDIGPGGKIICKLLDGNDNIVAEGNIKLSRTFTGSITTMIPIQQVSFDNANDVQNIEK